MQPEIPPKWLLPKESQFQFIIDVINQFDYNWFTMIYKNFL